MTYTHLFGQEIIDIRIQGEIVVEEQQRIEQPPKVLPTWLIVYFECRTGASVFQPYGYVQGIEDVIDSGGAGVVFGGGDGFMPTTASIFTEWTSSDPEAKLIVPRTGLDALTNPDSADTIFASVAIDLTLLQPMMNGDILELPVFMCWSNALFDESELPLWDNSAIVTSDYAAFVRTISVKYKLGYGKLNWGTIKQSTRSPAVGSFTGSGPGAHDIASSTLIVYNVYEAASYPYTPATLIADIPLQYLFVPTFDDFHTIPQLGTIAINVKYSTIGWATA